MKLLLCILPVLMWGGLLGAAERVALVVGCAHYQADPGLELATPVQDAEDLGALLRSPALGFKVISKPDATVEQFYAGLREFRAQAQGARVALVYFSGHGIEHDGQNYLITVNATLDSEDDLETQTVPLEKVMKDLGGTGAMVKLAVLDCCRNNPFAKTTAKSWMKTKDFVRDKVLRELGEAEIPQATLVCFATSAGRKAAAVLDDQSRNSPFTQFFLKELGTPGLSLRSIFENVHDELKEATGGRQLPVVKSDDALSEVFRQTVLVPGDAPPPAPVHLQVPAPTAAPTPKKMVMADEGSQFSIAARTAPAPEIRHVDTPPTSPAAPPPDPGSYCGISRGMRFTGRFLYGRGYAGAMAPVSFNLMINSVAGDGEFTGMTSEPYSGFGLTNDGQLYADVSGHIQPNGNGKATIVFTKIYRGFDHPGTNYSGAYSRGAQTVRGTWAIRTGQGEGAFELSVQSLPGSQ